MLEYLKVSEEDVIVWRTPNPPFLKSKQIEGALQIMRHFFGVSQEGQDEFEDFMADQIAQIQSLNSRDSSTSQSVEDNGLDEFDQYFIEVVTKKYPILMKNIEDRLNDQPQLQFLGGSQPSISDYLAAGFLQGIILNHDF